MKMNNQAVIFDMDGVICHTNPYHTEAYKKFLAKRQIHPTEEEFVQHMYGKNNRYILSHFLGRKIEGQEFIDMENEKEALFREIYSDQIVPIAGYPEFLEKLKAEGFKIGVATSAPYSNLKLIIDALGIEDKMDSMLASEDVSQHKPDPEVYLKSAANLETPIENCIVFEDSHAGVSAAINAGMRVIGVLSSHTTDELPPCQYYINDYSDITIENVKEILNQVSTT